LNLGFGTTGLESVTSSAEVIYIVSSVEVTVEMVIVASDDGNDDNGTSIAEDKGENI